MEDPTVWAGIWLAVAVLFGIGEILAPGSFFLVPFAVGAVAASLVSFFGAPVVVGWIVFIVMSLITFFALRPLARKLDIDIPNPTGIGANRLVGHAALVNAAIPANGAGSVNIGPEEWKAEGINGVGFPLGTNVRVVEVRGTRVVVEPAGAAGAPPAPGSPSAPPVA